MACCTYKRPQWHAYIIHSLCPYETSTVVMDATHNEVSNIMLSSQIARSSLGTSGNKGSQGHQPIEPSNVACRGWSKPLELVVMRSVLECFLK